MNQVRLNTLLEGLSKTDDLALLDNLNDFDAPTHTILQRAGEVVGFVYFPLAGMISQLTVMANGEAVETAAIGYDSASGFNSALSGRNANCQSIVQLRMKSRRIAARPFLNAYDQSLGVRRMVHTANEMLIEQIQQGAACHALHAAETRLARWLLQSHDYAGKTTLDLTQDFVSEMIGVRRSTVSQIAAALQKEGLIKYNRGHVQVINREGLEARCCECYHLVANGRMRDGRVKPLAVPPL